MITKTPVISIASLICVSLLGFAIGGKIYTDREIAKMAKPTEVVAIKTSYKPSTHPTAKKSATPPPPPTKPATLAKPTSKIKKTTVVKKKVQPHKVVKTYKKGPTVARGGAAGRVVESLALGVGPTDANNFAGKQGIPVVLTTYATKFDGRRTASGVVYKHSGYVCAAKSYHFPMGTRLAIVLGNKATTVVIGDTGGLPHGTVTRKPVDLSGRATLDLGIRPGVYKAKAYILE